MSGWTLIRYTSLLVFFVIGGYSSCFSSSRGLELTESENKTLLSSLGKIHSAESLQANSRERRIAIALQTAPQVFVRDEFFKRDILPLLGCLSGLPLSKFAEKEAGSSSFLQAYLPFSTFSSVGITRIWALSLLGSIVKEIKKPVTHVFVNTLSILSAMPLTYKVWDSEQNVFLTGISFVSEWSIATLGFYEATKHSPTCSRDRSSFQLQSEGTFSIEREELLSLYYSLLNSPNMDQKCSTIVNILEQEGDGVEKISELLPLIVLDYSRSKASKKYLSPFFYIVPFSSAIVNTVLAYNEAKDFTSSIYLKIPFIFLTTFPSLVLQLYTTSSTVDDLWNESINKRKYFRSKNKKAYYLVSIGSLLLSFGSAAWGVGVVKDSFEHTLLQDATIFFVATTAAQIVIFESHCIRDFFSMMYFKWKAIKGREDEKDTIKVIRRLSNLYENIYFVEKSRSWSNLVGWISRLFRRVTCRCR